MDKKLDPPKPPYPKNNPWVLLIVAALFVAIGLSFIFVPREAILLTSGHRTVGRDVLASSDTILGIGWLSLTIGLLITAGYFKLWNDIKKGR